MLGSFAAVYCCWLETILVKQRPSDLAIYRDKTMEVINYFLKCCVGKSLILWQVTEMSLGGFFGGFFLFVSFLIPCFLSCCTSYYNSRNRLLILAKSPTIQHPTKGCFLYGVMGEGSLAWKAK